MKMMKRWSCLLCAAIGALGLLGIQAEAALADDVTGRVYFDVVGDLDYQEGPGLDVPVNAGQPVELWTALDPKVLVADTMTGAEGTFTFTGLPTGMMYELRLDVSAYPSDAGARNALVFMDAVNFNTLSFGLTATPVAGPVMTMGPAMPAKVGLPLVMEAPQQMQGQPNSISGRAYFDMVGDEDYQEGGDQPVGGQPVQLWLTVPRVMLEEKMTEPDGTFSFDPQAPNMGYEVVLDVSGHPTAGTRNALVFETATEFNIVSFDLTVMPTAGPVVTDDPARPRKVGFPLVMEKPEDTNPGQPNSISGRAYFDMVGNEDYQQQGDMPVGGQPVQLWLTVPRVMLAETLTNPLDGTFSFPPQPPSMTYEVVLDVSGHPTAGARNALVFETATEFNIVSFDLTVMPTAGPVVTDDPARPRKVGFPLVMEKPEDTNPGQPNSISGRAYFDMIGDEDYQPGDMGVGGQLVMLYRLAPRMLIDATVTGPEGSFQFPPQLPNAVYEVVLDVSGHPTAGTRNALVFETSNQYNLLSFDLTVMPAAGPVVTDDPARPRKVGFPLVMEKPEDTTPEPPDDGGMDGGACPKRDRCHRSKRSHDRKHCDRRHRSRCDDRKHGDRRHRSRCDDCKHGDRRHRSRCDDCKHGDRRDRSRCDDRKHSDRRTRCERPAKSHKSRSSGKSHKSRSSGKSGKSRSSGKSGKSHKHGKSHKSHHKAKKKRGGRNSRR
jgi:hypothetical protein